MNIVISEDFCEVNCEVVISTWLVDDGDAIEEGMAICEIMAEKAQMEFISSVNGVIKLIAAIEQPLTVGDVIATVN